MKASWLRLTSWWQRRGGEPRDRAELGRFGEALAAQELARQGHRLVIANWRDGNHEIDLVTWDGETLVFVEVRTRQEGALIAGAATLTARKRQALQESARRYRQQLRKPPAHFRFDLVAVAFTHRHNWRVQHYKAVALGSDRR